MLTDIGKITCRTVTNISTFTRNNNNKKKDDSFKIHTETENSPSEKDPFPVRNTKLTSASAIHSALLHSAKHTQLTSKQRMAESLGLLQKEWEYILCHPPSVISQQLKHALSILFHLTKGQLPH